MDNATVVDQLNEAINRYFEKICLANGNVRYWPKPFVTQEMLGDEQLVSVFLGVASSLINTRDNRAKEAINESPDSKSDVASVSKRSGRSKGS